MFRKRMAKRTSPVMLCMVAILVFLVLAVSCGAAKAPVQLRWFVPGEPEELAIRQQQLDRFHELNPDISVKFEEVTGDRWQKMLTLIAAGQAPDVLYMQGRFVRPLAARGGLLNLEPFIEKDESMITEQFYPGWLDAVSYNGEHYALPQEFTPIVLFYNKDIFKQSGVAFPDDTWDWETFTQACKKLTSGNRFGMAVDTWILIWPVFVWQNGGTLFNVEETMTTLDQPESYNGLQYLADLFVKHKVAPTPAMAPELGFADGIFMSGNAAMTLTGAWMIPSYRARIKDFGWDVAPLPKGKIRATSAPNLYYGISTQTKHPEEAWRFLKFLVGPEGQKIIAENSMALPTVTDPGVNKLFLEGHPPEHVNVFIDSMEYASHHFETMGEKFIDIIPVLQPAVELVLNGEITAERAMKDLAPRINAILAGK